MLEFYRKHYMTNNPYINCFDIIIALIFTRIFSDSQVSLALKAPLLSLLWLRAALTVVCMIRDDHMMRKDHKKPGIGSVSLLFVAFAVLWSVNLKNGVCIGDIVLEKTGLPAWANGSEGFHFTLIYSLIFLIPALILANKYPDHLFAKTSKAISWIGALMIISFLIIIAFI